MKPAYRDPVAALSMVVTYCGIDWAKVHHSIALVDDDGKVVAKRRIQESQAGLAGFTGLYDLEGPLITGGGRYGDRGRWLRVVPVSV